MDYPHPTIDHTEHSVLHYTTTPPNYTTIFRVHAGRFVMLGLVLVGLVCYHVGMYRTCKRTVSYHALVFKEIPVFFVFSMGLKRKRRDKYPNSM